ncbi:MAG TPA: MFS transporter [Caulobacteraceae bacterium]
MVGNGLEFYDFTTYAFFAVQIGQAFFPSKVAFVSLILSLATFGSGFLLRPVGALVIGRYGDRIGRKPAMLLTMMMMGLAVVGLALTPTYAQIGVLAPVMALAWRLLQGFALGGEVGPSTAFLVEAAPPGKRGLYTSWQFVSQAVASIAGGLVGVTVANFAGEASLRTWGWRLAFLLGGLILPFGYWLRRTLPETIHQQEPETAAHPADTSLKAHAPILMVGLGLIAAATIGTYVMSFMTTYALTTLKIPARTAFWTPIVIGLCAIAGTLGGAVLCDRYGRKPLIVWPRVVSLLMILPAFTLIVRNRDETTLLVALGSLVLVGSFSAAAILVGLTESMHRGLRSAGVGTLYAVAVAALGGSTQPIVAWLIHATGDPLMPAYYLVGAGLIGLAAALAFTESAPPVAATRAPLRRAAAKARP